jgi:integrase
MLSRDIEEYIDLRRTAGFKFNVQSRLLKSFAAFAVERGDEFVRTDRVIEWAIQAPSPAQKRDRLLTVRRFALHIRAEDSRHEVPASDALGRGQWKRPVPRIFAPDEIRRLMTAAAEMGPAGSIRPLTMTTLVGLLAATGLRISEALALHTDDVTDDGLIVRQTKCQKSRLVPLHDSVRLAMERYLVARRKQELTGTSLFVFATGRTPAYGTVAAIFRRLVRSINLKGGSFQNRPRIHGLRHTFAVRSLEQCSHDRSVVTSHMVALSTYLGHTYVGSTYWYLEATPILMKQIAEAGEALHQGGIA